VFRGSGDGAEGAQGVASCQSFFDEGQKTSCRVTGNNVERNEGVSGEDQVFVVGVEDAEVVLGAE
jgi:hypothetical protein